MLSRCSWPVMFGLCRFDVVAGAGEKKARNGRNGPGHRDPTRYIAQPRVAAVQAASADLAFSAIAWNAAGSWIARSDKTLRSTVMPDLERPSMNRL